MSTAIKRRKKRLGQILVEQKCDYRDQARRAPLDQHAQDPGQSSAERLIEMKPGQSGAGHRGGGPPATVSNTCAWPITRLTRRSLVRFLRTWPAISDHPCGPDEHTLTVALSDPANIYLLDDIKLRTKMEIVPLMSLQTDIEAAIEKYYGVSGALEDMIKDFGDGEDVELLQKRTRIRKTSVPARMMRLW